jgi:hypothetical protein
MIVTAKGQRLADLSVADDLEVAAYEPPAQSAATGLAAFVLDFGGSFGPGSELG